ncbi:winged helix-turn-helix domain-containing protein [uncultured Bradyrhizobium sp.]|uniref:winged helix-turn-helix domain-containing tetratricopeptide repeat protein n=1 Tax=Bradyrhizobium sp. TaxID=376 RepID=UPI002630B147|nr:winged helix-turn-helix domain-containing protein [uncultured Bradyrhizobium sp.]
MATQHFAFGPFVLDLQRGALMREDRLVAVGHKGLALLHAMLRSPGQVLSKAALMEAAWADTVVEDSNLSVQIAALRKLLGPQPDGSEWIATVSRAGYRFVGSVYTPESSVRDAPPAGGQPANLPDRPSIVVLPFANVSGDKEQEYLADGITEDIITTLTRFRWFRVTGRNSSFAYKGQSIDSKKVAHELGTRYVLEGSVRRSGQHLRISAQLVDAASASQIWAERYEMELKEAFAVQDAIAERVAGAIEPELLKTESLPAAARHSGNVTAWDLVRKGTWHFHHVGRDTHLKARDLFRRACRLDPELAEAHIWLARVSAGVIAYGWSDKAEQDIREGLDAALKAIQLDERNPYSHYALAICSAYANAPEQAVLAAEKAIEISPSFALGHLVLGMGQLFRGSAGEAASSLERGLTLNPHDPQNFVWCNLLALASLFAGKAEDALGAAVKARKLRPAWRPIFETLACCYAALGRLQEAGLCIDQMRQLEELSADALGPLRLRNRHWMDEVASLLKKAGWQE